MIHSSSKAFLFARRLVSALMILSVTVSSVEAVGGEARDGEVHHETAVQAASHASASNATHGHESRSERTSEQDGTDHEHGTAADHCTHAHGMAVPVLGVGTPCQDQHRVALNELNPSPSDRSVTPRLQPPRV